ncbi:MAG TPA: transporter [Arachidicoccus sp.]
MNNKPYFSRKASYSYKRKAANPHLLFTLMVVIFFLINCQPLYAQDPQLPPTNLGITNMQDGKAPGPGWYYMQFVQAYQANKNRDGNGKLITGIPQISSLLSMQQIIYISKIKFLGGNLGYTAIVSLVKLSAVGNTAVSPSINPNPFGDIITGPMIQWFNKKLFGMDFSHRLELDFGIPAGAYQSKYDINPSAHVYRIFPHYTFTLTPWKNLSFSMRHHLTYYFNEIGTSVKPGFTYNFNYSAEYTVARNLTVELAGYYLKQLAQDSFDGDSHYYQNTYGISNTKERVFAYGPGIGYVTPSGFFIEIKGMKEAAVQNRSKGFRTTIAVAYKLDK